MSVNRSRLSPTACRRKYKRQQGLCFICDEWMDPNVYEKDINPLGWNRDHLHPRRLGGANRGNNIVLTHIKCNSRKGHKIPTERERIKYQRIFGAAAWRPG